MKKNVKAAKTSEPDTLCPIARAEDVVGDRWTVLVLRELFVGSRRFEEIQAQTGATPQMLADRLKRLAAAGLAERRPYQQRPPRYEYRLTDKGEAFYPVLLALRAWGERWLKAPGESLATNLVHRDCGHAAGLGPLCESCGRPLTRANIISRESPAYARERADRAERFKTAK